MSDYIKRADAIKAYAETIKSDKDTKAIAEFILAEVPSVDVVEVVRCKDCKYNPKSLGWVTCPMTGANTRKDGDYCSYGKREHEQDARDNSNSDI